VSIYRCEVGQDGDEQKPVSPHKLRHTCLTGLLKSGLNIREVQEIAGHASLNTTMIYTHVDNEELAAKMRNRK
jgi:site-specific recombinase XerD